MLLAEVANNESNSMDLLSLVITLRPVNPAQSPAVLPRWWGRAAHALLLGVVGRADPELAAGMHDIDGSSGPRPFTVSTLMGHFPGGKLDRDRPYTLRFTSFKAELSDLLLQAVQDGQLAPESVVELEYLPFKIETVDLGDSTESNPWSGNAFYQEFGAAYLLARTDPPRRITLQFTSPTTFKSAERHMPIPLPQLAFNSLLTRWNRFAPITFPESETRRYVEECLVISRYKLSSRSVPTKGRGLRVGAIGQITYGTINYDRYWMSLITVLAHYALYTGVGAGTAHGLGQCRVIDEP
jgi:CRISPR-associated endoribonuclease Cas6